MTNEKQQWFWVVGGTATLGFRITTKRPRGKFVREPHRTEREAQIWIANYFSQNA